MQRAMRLIPDLLKADLGKVSRYDLCRLVGRELPFEVLGEEFTQDLEYGTPILPMLAWHYDNDLILHRNLFDHMSRIIMANDYDGRHQSFGTHRFFMVGCCDESVLKSFDLRPANLDELFASRENIAWQKVKVSSLSARHGNCWLRYEYVRESIRTYSRLRIVDPCDDRRLYEEEYDGSPLHGSKCNTPTLVRRVVDLTQDDVD
jgi:hypothetical protein